MITKACGMVVIGLWKRPFHRDSPRVPFSGAE
jgi:hypothetical protein